MARVLGWLAVAAGSVACYTPPSAAPPTLAEVAIWTERPKLPEAGAAGWQLDVEGAIAYARAHGPVAGERRDAEAIATARIDAAGQLTNPELRLGRTFDGELGAVDRTFVGIRFHPDMPWERSGNVAAARADADSVRARSRVVERELATRIRRLYATLAFGEATREALVREIAKLTERQRLLAGQLARAAATQFDVVIADEDLLDLERARGTLELALVRARNELAERLGIPPGQHWQPVWDLAQLRRVETSFDRDALAARALANHPELAELAHRVRGADARAYRERTKRAPWIEGLQIERSVRRSTEWAAFVQISLPVFSLNGGAIAAADADAHAITAERRRASVRVVEAVDAAIAYARSTGARVKELAERMAVMDKAVGELTAQASASAVDPVKLLLIEERHGRAQRDVLAAALEHRLALIALAAVVGDR